MSVWFTLRKIRKLAVMVVKRLTRCLLWHIMSVVPVTPKVARYDAGGGSRARPVGIELLRKKSDDVVRVVCVSDTHGWHRRVGVPECDVLVHSGDICALGGTTEMIEDFRQWVTSQDARHAVVVAGNHDGILLKMFRTLEERKAFFHPAVYLENEEAVVGGLRIFGSPHSPKSNSNNNAWQFRAEEDLHRQWDRIPRHLDVLVTHAAPRIPPHTVKGDPYLARIVAEAQPRLHLCGHYHNDYNTIPPSPPSQTHTVIAPLASVPFHIPLRPAIVCDLPLSKSD
eukprot:TRINITY_DN4717_c0_g2_i1.p1 TRINITY_DN4717_c0_g2~~TRINITY_DN4717_c0_g2_i1.p1  ORF type:complete len:283 (+),score=60.17 TRINITY_DN4717_c0_g2_i1:537-1385(+)